MTRRIILQPATSVSTAQWQEVRFSGHTGGAKSLLVWINVLKNASGSALSIDLYGGSSTTLLDPSSGSNSYWLLLKATAVGAGAVGAFNGTSTTVPDFIRWRIPTLAAEVQFAIVVYLYDT